MIDIIGNIKLNKENRIRYFFYSLKSLSFIENSKFYINIDNKLDESEKGIILNVIEKCNIDIDLSFNENTDKVYSTNYLSLLNKSNNEYIFHFEEDHFCVLNDQIKFNDLINDCKINNVDVLRLTYFNITRILNENINFEKETDNMKITPYNFETYSKACQSELGHTYYLGTNNIFKREFAYKFWNRNIHSSSPHSYELSQYNNDFLHLLGIPKFEILRAIDSDHGLSNTCIINGNNNNKFDFIKKTIDEWFI